MNEERITTITVSMIKLTSDNYISESRKSRSQQKEQMFESMWTQIKMWKNLKKIRYHKYLIIRSHQSISTQKMHSLHHQLLDQQSVSKICRMLKEKSINWNQLIMIKERNELKISIMKWKRWNRQSSYSSAHTFHKFSNQNRRKKSFESWSLDTNCLMTK